MLTLALGFLTIVQATYVRPVLDGLNLGGIHLQTFFRKNEVEILNGVGGEVTFVWTSIEAMFSETTEDFSDMFPMICGIVGIE